MTEVTRYSKPWPQVTDHRDDDADSCPAHVRPWWCTRVAGHDGDHQAGGCGGQMYASWPAEEVAR